MNEVRGHSLRDLRAMGAVLARRARKARMKAAAKGAR